MNASQANQQLDIISDTCKLLVNHVKHMEYAKINDGDAKHAIIYDAVMDIRGLDSRISKLRSMITE